MDRHSEAYDKANKEGEIKAKFNATKKLFENNDNSYQNKEENVTKLRENFSGFDDTKVKKFLGKVEKLDFFYAYLEEKKQKITDIENSLKSNQTKLEEKYADFYQSLTAKANALDNQEPFSMRLKKAFENLHQEHNNDDPNWPKFSKKVEMLVNQYKYQDKLCKKILEIEKFAKEYEHKLHEKYSDLLHKSGNIDNLRQKIRDIKASPSTDPEKNAEIEAEKNKELKSISDKVKLLFKQFKEKFRPILDFFKHLGEKSKPCWEYLTRNRKSVDQPPNNRDASAHNHDTQTRKSPERSSTSDHSPKKRNKALRLLLKALKYLKGSPKRFGRAMVHEWDHHKKRGTALVIATVAGIFIPGVAAIAPFILPGYYGYRTATYNHYKEMSKKYGKPAEQSAKRKLVHAATGTEIYIPEKKRSREISYLIRHEAEKLKGEGKLDENDIELFKLKKKQVRGLLDENNPTPIEGWKVEPNEFSKPATKQEVEDLRSKILQLEDLLRERDTNQ